MSCCSSSSSSSGGGGGGGGGCAVMPTLLHSDYYALRTTGQVLELIQVLLATPTPVDCYGDYDFSAAWLSPPQLKQPVTPSPGTLGPTAGPGRARSQELGKGGHLRSCTCGPKTLLGKTQTKRFPHLSAQARREGQTANSQWARCWPARGNPHHEAAACLWQLCTPQYPKPPGRSPRMPTCFSAPRLLARSWAFSHPLNRSPSARPSPSARTCRCRFSSGHCVVSSLPGTPGQACQSCPVCPAPAPLCSLWQSRTS